MIIEQCLVQALPFQQMRTNGKNISKFYNSQTSLAVTKCLYNLDSEGAAVDKGTVIEYRNFKLQKGNVATDWSPAPEDQVNKGDVVNQTNAELELDGTVLRLKGEHVTVDTKISHWTIKEMLLSLVI